MSKDSNTATNYEKNDPDFPGTSQSVQSTRQVPTRNAKTQKQIIELSSDDDDNDSDISLNKTFIHSVLENQEMGTISEAQLEAILQRVIKNNNTPRQTSTSIPKVNIEPLTMTNYSFWSKSMRAGLKLMNLWIDPNKSMENLTNEENVINEKAAQYVLTNIDANNMSQITSENEQSFITIWNLLKQFHEPQTATTLVDFYSNIYKILHHPGENVRMHLLRIESQFEKLLQVDEKLPESHKVAIMLASVKNSPEFEQLFHSAKWLKREDLTLKLVKESIIAAQDSRSSEHYQQQSQETAHATKFQKSKKFHRRRPQNPQKGWACPGCQMDNHKESECFKKNRHASTTIKKQSHLVQNDEVNEDEDTTNFAEAFHGASSSTKRYRESVPNEKSSSIKSRLGSKTENSPYQGIFPTKYSSNAAHEQNVIEINNYDNMSDSGSKFHNSDVQTINHSQFQINPICQISKSSHQSLNSIYNSEHFNNEIYTNMNKNLNSKTNWIIDSGATIHMCNQKDLLSDYVIKKGHYVTISDGSKIPIDGFGNLVFSIIGDDNQKYKFILENVAFVPKLTVNLISVKELTALKITIAFDAEKCKIVLKDGSITIGTIINNSYMMKISQKRQKENTNLQLHLCLHDWHKRLSHRNIDHIKRIKNVLNLKIQKCQCNDECIDCVKGKISAPPFPKSSIKPELPLTLVTSDLCGQFRSKSLGGAKYFMTLIDAATDYTEVVTLKHKSDTATAIQNFMEKCKTKFGRYPQTFRSDRGGEFMSNEIQNFLKQRGISFECTVANTPQQNGISERKNRTLVEAIRTILISKNLPHCLWGEALHYANNTFNSIPKSNKENSPKEEFFGKKIPFEFLEFGAPVIFRANENQSKLEPKGAEGIFVGLDHVSKGYRIFYEGKIIIKRTVKFLKSSPELQKSSKHDSNQEIAYDKDSIELRRSKRIANQKVFQSQLIHFVPKTYKQALNCPDSHQWVEAMQKELESIHQHKTWSLVDLPENRTAIGNKWIFKMKTSEENKSVYKARLVAQGFTQIYGENYDEVFAPVARPTSFRILLTIAGKENMSVLQFDVKTAFLHGNLKEEIYMKPPKGFAVTDKVLKLNKSLYGLKQAARVWNQAMNDCLIKLNFKQSKNDNCLYVNHIYTDTCYLIIHVDDMLIACKNITVITNLANEISKTFELKCLGEVKQFIGITVERQRSGIFKINQSNYIKTIAETFQLQDAKGSLYPLDPGYFKLNDENLLNCNNEYRKVVGMLLYVATNTRPDIAAAIGILSQRLTKPRKLDLNECFRVIKYLLKTHSHSLILGSKNQTEPLIGYTDANWAENRVDRKSTSGFLCKVFNGTVSWSSKRQNVISISTTESEFYALAETVREIKWIKSLLKDFNINITSSIPIHIDSQSCIKMIENEKFSNQTKHIDVRYHFAREEIINGSIKLVYEPTNSNIADMLTKPLAGTKIKNLRELANIKEQ